MKNILMIFFCLSILCGPGGKLGKKDNLKRKCNSKEISEKCRKKEKPHCIAKN